MGIDILGIDIMGVDILGIDTLALPHTHLVNLYSCLVSLYSFWSIRTHFGQFVLNLK